MIYREEASGKLVRRDCDQIGWVPYLVGTRMCLFAMRTGLSAIRQGDKRESGSFCQDREEEEQLKREGQVEEKDKKGESEEVYDDDDD